MNDLLKRGMNSLKGGFEEIRGIYLKKQNIKTLTLLIMLSGVFCLRALLAQDGVRAEISDITDDVWFAESITGNQKISLTSNALKRQEVIRQYSDFYLPENSVKLQPTEFETELSRLVANYPISEMAPYIAGFDRQIAGLIIGIAKKESDWGKHSPSKNGADCYNYWGYKGAGENGTAMGYACFGSSEEAVRVVGGRIAHFVGKKMDTPSKMVVWKCGSSCSWDNPKNVQKWVSDVSVYYNQIAYKN